MIRMQVPRRRSHLSGVKMIAPRKALECRTVAWMSLLAVAAGVALAGSGTLPAQETPGPAGGAEAPISPEQEPGPSTRGALSDRFRSLLVGGDFRLLVNLHQPERGGHPAPWLDARGWHARDITRPLLLGAGERVQVTGIFDYADRSLFVELTRWPTLPWGGDPVRARIRITAAASPEAPEAQDGEIRKLLALVIGEAPES